MNKKISIIVFAVVIVLLGAWFFQARRNIEPASSVSLESPDQTLDSWVNKNGVIDSFSDDTLVIKSADGSSFSCVVSGTTKIASAGVNTPIAKGDIVFVRLDTNAISVSRGASLADVSAGPGIFVGSAVSVASDSALLRSASGEEKTIAMSTSSLVVVQSEGSPSDLKAGASVGLSCHKEGSVYRAATVSVLNQ